jgi:hypothetical protein
LSIANGAEAAEKFAGNFAELRPARIGINFLHDRGEGPATTNGDAKIVDGIGLGSGTKSVQLDDDATRPERKGAGFSARARKMHDCER